MERTDEASKIGAGHASAMFRQGLRELRAAVYPESNVAQPAEYGLYGTRTPGEIAESRRPDARDLDEERESTLSKVMEQAERRSPREGPGKDLDRDA